MNEPVIRTEAITKRYGKTTAVENVSLEVPPGTVFALLGCNGAGKTSLIKMLLGLSPISGGKGTVLGLDSAKQHVQIRQRVGYVPEAHHMYGWMTIAEVVRFTAAFYPNWNDALCAELLKKFGLDPAKRIKELSRGMLAKTALTLALAHEPKLLVLDEPTDGLDAVVRKEFLENVVAVAAEEGRTVFISSHLLQDVERVAERAAVMDQSRLLFVEDVESLKRRVREILLTFPQGAPERFDWPGMVSIEKGPREWKMVVKDFSDETLPKLRAALPQARIEPRTLCLEEVFVALMGKQA